MTEMIRPGVAAAAGSQVTVIDRLHAAAPFSRPFVVYSEPDLTATATGNANVESYCAWPPTAASRYQLDRADHNQIFHFDWTFQGVTAPTYCLDKFKDGPYGDVPYQSAAFETIFPAATARQKKMLTWILANAYPAVSAAETFALVGVDANEAPVLDDNDAYAAVQVAIWVLLGQIAPDEATFLNCGETTLHPKSARMRAAVLQLIQLAGNYADAVPSQTDSGASACQCGSSLIQCCKTESGPTNVNDPQLSFRGCPCEVRSVCGRLLVGPFTLNANLAGTPTITIEPFCACGADLSADFADFCGNPIAAPGLGEEFYLALRFCGGSLCFQLNVSFSGTVTRVITMEPTSTALNYQPIGASLEDYPVTLTTSLCVCVTMPGSDLSSFNPGYSGYPGVLINNNNNNNNNNNVNTNGIGGGSQNGYPPMMIPPICMPYWCCPPYPAYPPFPPIPPEPPRPPYPPEPPWPPRPPYPPEPPWPPRPPYPPEPPWPPEPPCPPAPPRPPEPPCPPDLPEPPCPPTPPWPPQPPCPPAPPRPPEPPCHRYPPCPQEPSWTPCRPGPRPCSPCPSDPSPCKPEIRYKPDPCCLSSERWPKWFQSQIGMKPKPRK